MITEKESLPGLVDAVPAAHWCARHEMCWTLEDYLRRRTKIAQWIPHGGFGRRMENAPHLRRLAEVFACGEANADHTLEAYARKVQREARVLNGCVTKVEEIKL